MEFRRDVALLQGTARVEVRVGDQEAARTACDLQHLAEEVRGPPGEEFGVTGRGGRAGRGRRRRIAAKRSGERESRRAEGGRSDKVAAGGWGGGRA